MACVKGFSSVGLGRERERSTIDNRNSIAPPVQKSFFVSFISVSSIINQIVY